MCPASVESKTTCPLSWALTVCALRLSVERAFGDADKVLKQLLRLAVSEERSGLPAP